MIVHVREAGEVLQARHKTKGFTSSHQPIYRLLREYPNTPEGWSDVERWTHAVGHSMQIEKPITEGSDRPCTR